MKVDEINNNCNFVTYQLRNEFIRAGICPKFVWKRNLMCFEHIYNNVIIKFNITTIGNADENMPIFSSSHLRRNAAINIDPCNVEI